MLVVLATLVVALATGGLTWLVVRRWPSADPGSPTAVTSVVSDTARHDASLRRFLHSRLDTKTATGLGLTIASTLVVVALAWVGIVLAMVRRNAGFARFDLRVAEWGSRHASPTSTSVLRGATQLGSTNVLVVLTVVVAVVGYRRAPSRAVPAFLALVLLGQLILANAIKAVVDRARPDIDPLAGFAGPSFPSGHATAAAAAFAAFALVLGRRRSMRAKAALLGVATAVAAAVAASRVLLGVHWLTDVLAGLALGWGWFAVCAIAFGGRLLRFGAPLEGATPDVVTEQP